MFNFNRSQNKKLIAAFGFGVLFGMIAIFILLNESDQQQKIGALESKIKDLEQLLAEQDKQMAMSRIVSAHQNMSAIVSQHESTSVKAVAAANRHFSEDSLEIKSTNSLQRLKDLSTKSSRDSRTFSEKVSDLLSIDESKENIAIVSKSVFDLASDTENLPDYALQNIYQNQTSPDLKRVVAQVAAMRGNADLIENQIAEMKSQLKNNNPSERQRTLVELAKTHSALATSAIAPMLQDTDINVRLDALLALRATGNQTHIHLIEPMLRDSDPAISSLASDVVSSLKNLSDSARTTISAAEIAAELPLLENP